jgi:hypothetical protein
MKKEKKSYRGKEKKKALQLNAKGLGMVRLPLLVSFRTFKGNITIENIRLKQLIFQ